jgi:hypothetical protein
MSRAGYVISWPVAITSYDFVAERFGRVLRVQVKTARRRSRPNREYIVLDFTGGDGKRYEAGAVDMFVGYDQAKNRAYYVTAEELRGRREVWIDTRKLYEL